MTAATSLLLRLYANPVAALDLTAQAWPAALGAARRSRTLGHLGLRLREAGALVQIHPAIAGHFLSASRVIEQRRRLLRWELLELSETLADMPFAIVLLKGAAYELQGLPLAGARLAADVDLLVPRQHLDAIERRLLTQGWRAADLTPYDERYYRKWSQELPAFAHPDRQVEVDIHHSITPALSGDSQAMQRLLRDSCAIAWNVGRHGRAVDRFRSLEAVDQLVHAAVHTFTDSDMALRLREVMDFDLLYRQYAKSPADFDSLLARASELGLERAVWWALHFSSRWLGTPVPCHLRRSRACPSRPRVRAMDWLADRAMLPGMRQRRRRIEAFAQTALLVRYHWQRMPLFRLLPHLIRKAWRRLCGHR